MERSVRSGPTWSLLALVTLTTAVVGASALRSVLTAVGARQVSDAEIWSAGLVGVFGEDALRNAEYFAALVTAPAAVVSLIMLLGLLTWRSWAREAVLAVFGLVGALLCVFALAGTSGGARNAGEWLVAAVALLGVAALAMSPPVCADFDRHRIAGEVRERKQREQERLEQERTRHEQYLRERHLRDQALRDRLLRDGLLRNGALPEQPRRDQDVPDQPAGA